MSRIRALIVDDEPLARAGIRDLLRDTPHVEVVGECADGVQAIGMILSEKPDLIFLDIQMPEIGGFEVIEQVGADAVPAVIFVTAYDEYALKAFDVHALDYILKPIDSGRFAEAVQRAIRSLSARRTGDLTKKLDELLKEMGKRHIDRFIIKTPGRISFLRSEEVDWIEADGDYVCLHTGERKHLIREKIGRLERRLDPAIFARIHRSTIVRLDRIREIQPLFSGEYTVILRDGNRLSLSLRGAEVHLGRELRGIALEVMRAVMELEILGVVGVKGSHLSGRKHFRWGKNPGSVVIDGVRERCEIPRAVSTTHLSYRLRSYGLFRQAGDLIQRAYVDLIRGISTRRYSEGVSQFLHGYGFSASSVSRRMVAATAKRVEELLSRSLAELELAVLMIDGVDVGGHTVVVALGIDSQGKKHILGFRQGATENTAVARGLLEDLVERGLSVERSMLVVIDGAKALRKAVAEVLGRETPVQRCTVHKKRNVLEHLSRSDRPWVSRRLTRAYNENDETKARRQLLSLAGELERINPDAAKSLLEGLDETLTMQRLGLPHELRQSLRSTNIIESAINGVRDRSRNVKNWRNGRQVERWTAAGLLETEKKFRRIKGYKHLNVLLTALENHSKPEIEAA